MQSFFAALRILVLAHLAAAAHAANWVVDSNPGSQAVDFQDIQSAIDAAAEGDTIFVRPAGDTYDDFVITKGINLYGPGWALAQTLGAGHMDNATLSDIVIARGVENVVISGFWVEDAITFGQDSDPDVDAQIANVLLYRNRLHEVLRHDYFNRSNNEIERFGDLDISGLTIINNWFNNGVINPGYQPSYGGTVNVHDVTIIGNVFFGESGAFYGAYLYLVYTSSTAVISHNYFRRNSFISINQGVVSNNIFNYGENNGVTNSVGSLVTNNVFIAAWPSETSNWERSDNLKVESNDIVLQESGRWAEWYRLAPGSAAAGAGVDGVDAGIFAGPHPWDPLHLPPMPYISELSAPSVVAEGADIAVTIDAASHE